jgi:LytS/YehU family sensor histidine kinase
LDFLSKYLEIEQTRFRDRLTVVFDVRPDTFDALVPNLILQPLVENAIRHGIGPRESGGSIRVTATVDGAALVMVVEDDGVGMGNAPAAGAGAGLGLSSVRLRLNHLYGGSHRFETANLRPSGTRVLISVPYQAAGA